MSKPILAISKHKPTVLPPVIESCPVKSKNKFIETIQSKKVKQAINNWSNWGSAGLNVLTFTNANFHVLDQFQDLFEKLSELATKAAYAISSVAGTVDLWGKKNPLSFAGFASGIPLTLLSTNYNLYLAYGIPYGLGNFVIITDQREIVDKNGEPIPDKNGNIQLVSGDFSSRGWLEGFKITLQESIKIIKELVENPQKIKKISHALFASSVFEMIGPVLGYSGLEKLGSFVRSSGTIATQTAFLLHNDSNKKSSVKDHGKITLKSSIALGGLLGIGGSAIDFIKRVESISEKIANLTNLSLALDRGMGALIVSGIMDIEDARADNKATSDIDAKNENTKKEDLCN